MPWNGLKPTFITCGGSGTHWRAHPPQGRQGRVRQDGYPCRALLVGSLLPAPSIFFSWVQLSFCKLFRNFPIAVSQNDSLSVGTVMKSITSKATVSLPGAQGTPPKGLSSSGFFEQESNISLAFVCSDVCCLAALLHGRVTVELLPVRANFPCLQIHMHDLFTCSFSCVVPSGLSASLCALAFNKAFLLRAFDLLEMR